MRKHRGTIILCLIVGAIMTLYPPHLELYYAQHVSRDHGLIEYVRNTKIEYHALFSPDFTTDWLDGTRRHSTPTKSSIALDRLFLQYLVVAAGGFIIILLKRDRKPVEIKKE